MNSRVPLEVCLVSHSRGSNFPDPTGVVCGDRSPVLQQVVPGPPVSSHTENGQVYRDAHCSLDSPQSISGPHPDSPLIELKRRFPGAEPRCTQALSLSPSLLSFSLFFETGFSV